MAIEVIPTGAALGAEIAGLDLSGGLTDGEFEAVHRAWLDHCLIYFRGQTLTDEAMVRFSARFGTR